MSQLLPAYNLFLQGTELKHSFSDVQDSLGKEKIKLILLKSPAGTLFLEVNYLKSPDNIENISQVHVPSIHGSNTPPCIEWQAVSLSVSDTSSDLSPPFSPLGNTIKFFKPDVLPKFLSEDKEELLAPVKKERKSYDVSQLARECNKILNNFDTVLKDVENGEEVMKEFYTFLWMD